MTKLCLNMIVRNEADKIERCLTSVAPWIDYWVINDTGSSDDTVDRITKFFEGRSIPGHFVHGKFLDFGQARNEALEAARSSEYPWDYLLLCDADMEFMVDDPDFKKQLTGSAYHVVQKGGGTAYHNTRLVSRAATGKYIGVTHEYLDIPTVGTVQGVWYHDHADGSNRSNKARRDIRLLRGDLSKNPTNGRSWFYLAQSYKDSGQFQQAIKAFDKAQKYCTWDEEIWYSKYQAAHCHAALGAKASFVRGLLDAYAYRPSRAEPLYDLSKYYREKGEPRVAVMFAEEGLRIPYPKDYLFVQEWVYKTGLREEFSIAGYYDDSRRKIAGSMANGLSLDPTVPVGNRQLAKNNLFFYLKPLCEYIPSFATRRIPFTPPDDYTAMNPSIADLNGELFCCVRSVNYTMDEAGRYLIKGTNGEANSTNPINTRNFLVKLHPNFTVDFSAEIFPPEGFPPPAYNLVTGFEDTRLFAWRGELWTISNVREQNPEGWCEQVLAKLGKGVNQETYAPTYWYHNPKKILPAVRQHEKNWAPFALDRGTGDLRFVYRLGEYLDPDTAEIVRHKHPYAAETLSGGSQYIPYNNGYLSIVHEAHVSQATGKRYYTHRFVWLDVHQSWLKVSRPFVFHDKVIEFAAGMAWHPDKKRILISYGREDKEAWIASVNPIELMEFLLDG